MAKSARSSELKPSPSRAEQKAHNQTTSQALSPSDHATLLVDLLKPTGLELGRRWLAALLLVPPDQREALVAEVERRVTLAYGDRSVAGDPIEHASKG